MKVFVSWSGNASREVAELIQSWLPCVIQDADVWVSSQSIEKGQRWLPTIGTNLEDTNFGIIVATPANKNAPWLMFEAGALSKSFESRVTVLLCGIDHADVISTPLFQFQNATAKKDEFFSVVRMINSYASRPMPDGRLSLVFEKFWPDFENDYARIEIIPPKIASSAPDEDRLARMEGVLEGLARSIQRIQADTKTYPLPKIVQGSKHVNIPEEIGKNIVELLSNLKVEPPISTGNVPQPVQRRSPPPTEVEGGE